MHSKDAPHKYRAIDADGYYMGDRLHKLHPTQHIETNRPDYDPATQRARWGGKRWVIETVPTAEDAE